MSEPYYKHCRELDICHELIEKYFNTQQYEKCFEGHLALAEQGYPLAECQIGYFYYDGLGVEKDLEKAVYWTRRAADHGDRDGQSNLAWFYEDVITDFCVIIRSKTVMYGTLGNAYEGIRLVVDKNAESYGKAAMGEHTYDISSYLPVGFGGNKETVF